METITIYIILAFICVTIGFIAGALVAMLFAEREKKQLLQAGDLLPEGIDRDRHTALVRLWRNTDGAVLVELQGRILTDIKQASTAQRLEIEAVTEKWLKWLGVRFEMPKPPTPPRPQPEPVKAQVSASPVPDSNPSPIKAEISIGTVPPVADRPKSMVEQVDEILQDLVTRSGLQCSVKITQDLREGIVVWLDGGRYVGVDGVPNAEIQKLIRAAAAEWERRSESSK
jgi:hypothetical protein